MATLAEAVQNGVLQLYTPPEWERRQPIRLLYVAPQLFAWVDSKKELTDPRFGIGSRLLVDHLEQMFCDMRCAQRPPAGDLRRIIPTSRGIWKMHPPKLRVYGWFPAVHTFAAVTAALESETKSDRRMNSTKLGEVMAFIRENRLEHTIVRGDCLAVFPTRR